MRSTRYRFPLALLLIIILTGCGDGKTADPSKPATPPGKDQSSTKPASDDPTKTNNGDKTPAVSTTLDPRIPKGTVGFTAEKLIERFNSNPYELARLYDKMLIVLVGDVVSASKNEQEDPVITFKGYAEQLADPPRYIQTGHSLSSGEVKTAGTIKVGQRIAYYSQLSVGAYVPHLSVSSIFDGPNGAQFCLLLLTAPAMELLASPALPPRPAQAVAANTEAIRGEVKADKKAAAEKYVGKLVEVSGPVHYFTGNRHFAMNQLWVRSEDGGIMTCHFPPSLEAEVSKLAERQLVKVEGIAEMTGNGDIELYDCRIIEKAKDESPTLTADALAKSFADGGDGDEKYIDNTVTIEGVVKSIAPDEYKNYYFIDLESPAAGPQVRIRVPGDEKTQLTFVATKLKAGQKVRFKGKLDYGRTKNGDVDKKVVGMDRGRLIAD